MPGFAIPCLSAVGLLAITVSTAGIEPRRDGFEEEEAGKAPTGWVVTTPGYQAVVSSDGAKEGRQCLRIGTNEGVGTRRVAILVRKIDATTYRGRKVRLRADLRVASSGPSGRAQLW